MKIFKNNDIKKFVNKCRLQIFFFIILIFSFTIVFHNTGEKLTIEVYIDNPKQQVGYRYEMSEIKKVFIEKRIAYGEWVRNNHKNLVRSETDKSNLDGSTNMGTQLSNRHKTRWVMLYLDSRVYKLFQKNLSTNLAYYSYNFYNALIISLSYLFCILSIEIVTGQRNFKASFLSHIGFMFYLYPIYFEILELFTIREMLAISGCVYFSLKKNIPFYLLFASIGVLNRETGLLLSFLYPLMNYKEKNYLLPLFLIPAIFVYFNSGIILQKTFYNFNNWFIHGTDVYNTQYIYSILRVGIYILPTVILLSLSKIERKTKSLLWIASLYFFSLLVGVSISNLYPFAVLLPLMLVLNSYSFKKI